MKRLVCGLAVVVLAACAFGDTERVVSCLTEDAVKKIRILHSADLVSKSGAKERPDRVVCSGPWAELITRKDVDAGKWPILRGTLMIELGNAMTNRAITGVTMIVHKKHLRKHEPSKTVKSMGEEDEVVQVPVFIPPRGKETAYVNYTPFVVADRKEGVVIFEIEIVQAFGFESNEDEWEAAVGEVESARDAPKESKPVAVASFPGSTCDVEPKNAKLLHEFGDLALFAGETGTDEAHNEAVRKGDPTCHEIRNSLFLRRKTKEGTSIWRLVMTSGGGWKDADGMDKWCKGCARDVRASFYVMKARLSADGRGVWLVCDPHVGTYYLVCRYNFDDKAFCVFCDGDAADEQPDGTILIKNRKTYLQDEKGEPLGAAWYDEWIAPDGKVVRKTTPSRKVLGED